MRKLILLLLLFTGIANAQIVNIPDANFKAKLLAADVTNQIAYGNGGYIKIDSNNNGDIEVSEAVVLDSLNVDSSNINNLTGVSSFVNLKKIDCSFNILTSLDVSNLSNLKILYCNTNNLSSLNVTSLTNLDFLSCSFNLLTSLNLDGLVNIDYLDCYNNQLTNLNLNDLVNIIYLNCSDNQLTSLDFTGLTNLQNLNISNNQITSFNFPTPLALNYFNCSYNNLSQIDVSNVICDSYNFSYNPNLTYINMKNGHQDGCAVLLSIDLDYICAHFLGLPSLQFICIDEGEADSWTIPSNIIMNSYCSFTPGGNYNTITGNIKLDANNNGCDASDLAQANIKVNINDGTNTGTSFTSNTGNYTFFTQAGSFEISPEVENPTWFTFSPTSATIPFADNNNNTATQDFCIAANGVHPDVEVVLAPIAPARPGFDATYELVYKNKGNQTLSGSVNLVFDDAKTDFISANPAVDNLAVNSLTWNYNNLLPFENRSIDVVLNVNSPLETPAVNIGDILNFTATINPISGDELPDDNTFDYNQIVVGSYDPNDITCLEGNNVAPSEIGEYLHYVINFENTGNYPAENVVVKTIVDNAKFDVNSLQLLNTSNPVDARITGNVVEFIFENIQLGGPGGHGHVLLKIKSKNTLVTGDEVAKSAGIYFDYNAPVDTGMATTVFQSLSNAIFEKDDSINVSPNPTNSKININCNNNVKKIELYDVQGRVLETHIGETKTLDISEKTNGIYFLKITTEKGSKVEKVIKE